MGLVLEGFYDTMVKDNIIYYSNQARPYNDTTVT